MPRPDLCGFRQGLGEPQGQLRDYRLMMPDGRGIHAREFHNHYSIHWDKWDPTANPLGHMIEDSPHWASILGVAGVLLVYKLFDKN